MIAARQTSLREQLQDLFRRVGREYWPVRVNLPLSDDAHKKLIERLKADPKRILQCQPVVNAKIRLDATKLDAPRRLVGVDASFRYRSGRADLHGDVQHGELRKKLAAQAQEWMTK